MEIGWDYTFQVSLLQLILHPLKHYLCLGIWSFVVPSILPKSARFQTQRSCITKSIPWAFYLPWLQVAAEQVPQVKSMTHIYRETNKVTGSPARKVIWNRQFSFCTSLLTDKKEECLILKQYSVMPPPPTPFETLVPWSSVSTAIDLVTTKWGLGHCLLAKLMDQDREDSFHGLD